MRQHTSSPKNARGEDPFVPAVSLDFSSFVVKREATEKREALCVFQAAKPSSYSHFHTQPIMFAASRLSPNALRQSATSARWTALRSFSKTSAVSADQYDVVVVGES